MNYQELIERLRSFEIDHEPDGWPAIRMREISAMCNAIESLLAENERLNHNLTTAEQTMREYQDLAAKRLEEIDRLKEIEQTNDTLLDQLGDKNAALLDQVAGLTKKHNALKKTVFTNTNREVTIRNRFFTAHDDGVADQNFDFDAYLRIDGDFIDDEKKRYAQMIACTLNDYGRLATELAKYRDAPVVGYTTTNEDGDLSMLFFDEQEARKYSGDDEPIKLIVKPGEEK